MLEIKPITVGSATLQGVQVNFPNAPLLMLVGSRGAVACGYLKIEVADRFDHALAVVSGVRSFDDVLAAPVKAVSRAAAALGVTSSMTGAEAAAKIA
jgi:uncharacterized protein YunC (DUF1805 family)